MIGQPAIGPHEDRPIRTLWAVEAERYAAVERACLFYWRMLSERPGDEQAVTPARTAYQDALDAWFAAYREARLSETPSAAAPSEAA